MKNREEVASIKRLPIIKFLDSLLFEKLRKRCMRVSNPCTFVPIDFLFQIENTKSEFLCFSIFKFKLKIENHSFFF